MMLIKIVFHFRIFFSFYLEFICFCLSLLRVENGRIIRVILFKLSKIEWCCVIDDYKQTNLKIRNFTKISLKHCPNPHMGLAKPPHMPILVLFALICIARFYRKKQPSGLEILIALSGEIFVGKI